jgi:predicted enzyme related to lactoylglutathione lyase
MDATGQRLKEGGVQLRSEPREVGDGIIVAAIEDPFGNVIGLIENPHFGKDQATRESIGSGESG